MAEFSVPGFQVLGSDASDDTVDDTAARFTADELGEMASWIAEVFAKPEVNHVTIWRDMLTPSEAAARSTRGGQ